MFITRKKIEAGRQESRRPRPKDCFPIPLVQLPKKKFRQTQNLFCAHNYQPLYGLDVQQQYSCDSFRTE